jgi:hypothetical protein
VTSKFDPWAISGAAYLPLQTRYINGIVDDDHGDLSYLKLGLSYSPLPLVDLFIYYRALTADSEVVDLTAKGYTLGAKISL